MKKKKKKRNFGALFKNSHLSRRKKGADMHIELTLESTAYTTGQLPVLNTPQIAMAGRSNVGKSSLINALAGRKKLAKVSSSPGKTRSVNFYLVSPYDFYLVDLPGYGYARASHEERRKWARVLDKYLVETPQLKGLALLLDCRLTPQALDLELADYAQANSLQILPVLTKADKCNQKERQARQTEWQDILGVRPLLVSAHRRSGIDRMWRALIFMATGLKPRDDGGEAA